MSREQTTKKFTENLAEIMERQNMTQTELSRRTGIAQGSLSKYLMGHREPTITPVTQIAKALGVTVDALLK